MQARFGAKLVRSCSRCSVSTAANHRRGAKLFYRREFQGLPELRCAPSFVSDRNGSWPCRNLKMLKTRSIKIFVKAAAHRRVCS
jgi:hypothetical protein